MHKEILSKAQVELLPLLQNFKREFYLVGRTAIALQIGHRRSIDFDLFKSKKLRPKSIVSKISEYDIPFVVTRNVSEQLFSVKLFRAQLSYFEDIDFSEPLKFIVPEPSESEIKQFLIEKALEFSVNTD